jgi:hypothetical protein
MGRNALVQPRFHIVATIPVEGFPNGVRAVISENGPLKSLTAYFQSRDDMSPAWYSKVAAAVGLLYDYQVAVAPADSDAKNDFFRNFARALRNGTEVLEEPWTTTPPLFWPRFTKKRTHEILAAVTAFSEWVAQETGQKALNPRRTASFSERIADYRQRDHRSANSLLKHLSSPSTNWSRAAKSGHEVPIPVIHTARQKRAPFLPLDHVSSLLVEGFRRRAARGKFWETHDVRGIMIAMLQVFGGLRASEPLHLFWRDVHGRFLDPKQPSSGITADVALYHPSDGIAQTGDGDSNACSRSDYLWNRWSRQPRNKMFWHPEYLGWKNLLIEDSGRQRSFVWWAPPKVGEPSVHVGALFWNLYEMYMNHVRPDHLNHPYLFVSLRDGAETFGQPYRLASWHKAFRRAVARIGLVSAKALGTTSHGLRHLYGQMLKWHGVEREVVMVMMHHRSIHSQNRYRIASDEEIRRSLDEHFAQPALDTAPVFRSAMFRLLGDAA